MTSTNNNNNSDANANNNSNNTILRKRGGSVLLLPTTPTTPVPPSAATTTTTITNEDITTTTTILKTTTTININSKIRSRKKSILFVLIIIVCCCCSWLFVDSTTKIIESLLFDNDEDYSSNHNNNNEELQLQLNIRQQQQQQQQKKQQRQQQKTTKTSKTKTTPRFVTIVDSGSEIDPNGRYERIKAISETWGNEANTIYVVSNTTTTNTAAGEDNNNSYDKDKMEKDIYEYLMKKKNKNNNNKILVLPNNIPDRSIDSIQYIIRRLVSMKPNPPDYVFFTNGHTYVLTENLCTYLVNKHLNPKTQHVYSGHPLQPSQKKKSVAFNPSSAGYILSIKSMKYLINQWDLGNNCLKEKHNPGKFIGNCMMSSSSVVVTKTNTNTTTSIIIEDTRNHLKQNRFHCFPLTRLVAGSVDNWYNDISLYKNDFGNNCCSNDTISFHYIDQYETRAIYKIRETLLLLLQQQQQQKLLPLVVGSNGDSNTNANTTKNILYDDEKLKDMLLEIWPKHVNGYSRTLNWLIKKSKEHQRQQRERQRQRKQSQKQKQNQKKQEQDGKGRRNNNINKDDDDDDDDNDDTNEDDDDPWKTFLNVIRKISIPPSNPVCSKQQLLKLSSSSFDW